MISSSRIDSAVSGRAQLVGGVGGELPLGGQPAGHPVRAARELGGDEVDLLDARRLERGRT